MKGREIINRITREKMPDIEQVREACQARPVQPRRGRKRLRLSVAAAFAAVLILFTAAAYAIAGMVYQRVETGTGWDIVILPNDEYGRQIYNEWSAGWITGRSIYWTICRNNHTDTFNAEAARFINEYLKGQVFTSDGTAIDFELAVPMTGIFSYRRHHIDDRRNTLYTADGHQIGCIMFFRTSDNEPHMVRIRTIAQVEAQYGFNSTYEEARAAFGEALRLPAAHTEMFVPPCFDLNDWQLHPYHSHLHLRVRYSTREPRGILDWCPDRMSITVETARDGYDGPHGTMYYLGGEATAHDIAGVAVYEINPWHSIRYFVWVHDGLAYRLNPPLSFSREMAMDIIRSMVE